MKKYLHLFLYLFLILLWIFPFKNLFNVDFVEGHDFSYHMWRILVLEKQFHLGHFFPRWLPDALGGFGVPIFTFIYGVPYYFTVLLKFMGFSYADAYRLNIFIPAVLSGLTFFIWMRVKYNEFVSAVASIVYIWTPYHFLTIFIRGVIGEIWFFVFIPLIFLSIDKINSRKYFAFGSIAMFLMLYSHNGLSLIFFPIIIGYIFIKYIKYKNRNFLIKSFILIMSGLAISSFYLIPALSYQSLLKNSSNSLHWLTFPPLLSFWKSKWEGGSVFGTRVLKMSFQIGYAQLFIFITGIFTMFWLKFIKVKWIKYIYLGFWLTVFSTGFIMMTEWSRIAWEKLPLIINIQFPYRFLAVLMFAISVISGNVLNLISRYYSKYLGYIIGIIFIILALFTNRHHLLARHKEINLSKFQSYHGSYDGGGEFLPAYFQYKVWKDQQQNIIDARIIGEGEILSLDRMSLATNVQVQMYNSGTIFIKRLYFPGWHVMIDGIESYQFEKSNGIFIPLTFGKHNIHVFYKTPLLIRISNWLSLIALIGIVAYNINCKIKSPKFLIKYKKNV